MGPAQTRSERGVFVSLSGSFFRQVSGAFLSVERGDDFAHR
eukprot:COSAG02_NODE_50233_length_322_cov_0.417040_1_plen_40_part_10